MCIIFCIANIVGSRLSKATRLSSLYGDIDPDAELVAHMERRCPPPLNLGTCYDCLTFIIFLWNQVNRRSSRLRIALLNGQCLDGGGVLYNVVAGYTV